MSPSLLGLQHVWGTPNNLGSLCSLHFSAGQRVGWGAGVHPCTLMEYHPDIVTAIVLEDKKQEFQNAPVVAKSSRRS